MSFISDTVGVFQSTGGQAGAVVGGLLGGIPGAVVGAAVGNEINYRADQAGEAIDQGIDWFHDTLAEGQEQLSDSILYNIEYSGFEDADITQWVDASTFSEFEYELPAAVGKFDTADYFSFDLTYNSLFYTELTDLTADVDLYLYDSQFNLLGSSSNGGTQSELIEATLSPGTYYIDAVSYDHVTTNYGLTVGSTII